MTNEIEPDFLSEAELLGCIRAFRTGPFTMEHAADCGLLALAVPTRFGGLYVSGKRRYEVYQALLAVSKEAAHSIAAHTNVCDMISFFGTPAQFDLYLPSLASGKRFGAVIRVRRTFRAYTSSCGFYLWGRMEEENGTRLTTSTLFLVKAVLRYRSREYARFFVLPAETSSIERSVKYDNRRSPLHGVRVSQDALLGRWRGSPITGYQHSKKWEAIRWRTDRSAS